MSLNSTSATTLRTLAVSTALLLAGQAAEANCGMDVCPMHASEHGDGFPLRPIVGARYTTVASDAAVLETTVGGLYQVAEPIQLGVLVPVVSVSQADERTTGLGNVVAFVSGAILAAPQTVVLNAGLQLELPTVSDPALGDGHFLLMPTLQAGWHPGNGVLMGTLGWGRVLDGGHKHGHGGDGHEGHDHAAHHQGEAGAASTPETIVNPHASSELLLRLDGGAHFGVGDQRLRLTARMDGVREVAGEGESDLIVNLGPAVGLVGERLTAELYSLVPVSKARRYTNRTGIRFRLEWP